MYRHRQSSYRLYCRVPYDAIKMEGDTSFELFMSNLVGSTILGILLMTSFRFDFGGWPKSFTSMDDAHSHIIRLNLKMDEKYLKRIRMNDNDSMNGENDCRKILSDDANQCGQRKSFSHVIRVSHFAWGASASVGRWECVYCTRHTIGLIYEYDKTGRLCCANVRMVLAFDSKNRNVLRRHPAIRTSNNYLFLKVCWSVRCDDGALEFDDMF